MFCDGSILGGNPGGWAVGGWVLKCPDGTTLKTGVYDLGRSSHNTSNIAEYAAIVGALDWIAENMPTIPVTVKTDSKTIVDHILDKWQASQKYLVMFRKRIWDSENILSDVEYQWIPRNQNKQADCISRSLYHKGLATTNV